MSTATLTRRPGAEELNVPRTPTGAKPVVVAVDDDDNAGTLLRHGREVAGRLGVPLRVTYVWSDCRPPYCLHHRRCHRDIGEAVRLLNALVDEHLTGPGPSVERDVIHDADPAAALAGISAGASLLVIGSASDHQASADELGETARALLGRIGCPVAVIPHRTRAATRPAW